MELPVSLISNEQLDKLIAELKPKEVTEADSERIMEESLRQPTIVTKHSLPLQNFLKEATFNASYFIYPLLQQGWAYSLTGRIGHGKTSFTVLLAFCTILNLPINVKLLQGQSFSDIRQGNVLYLAGENENEIAQRMVAMCEEYGIDASITDSGMLKLQGEDLPFNIYVRGRCRISQELDALEKEAREERKYTLVIVDTSTAYFEGDDENSAIQTKNHAIMLRKLAELTGSPCVIINCHPSKHAIELLPRGGYAFAAELDGNLTIIGKREDKTFEIDHHDKFRGPDFDPLLFAYEIKTPETLKDDRGRLVYTVVARQIDEDEKKRISDRTAYDIGTLLSVMLEHPNLSQEKLAKHMSDIQGYEFPRRRPQTLIDGRMTKDKMVFKNAEGKAMLTDLGKRLAKSWKKNEQSTFDLEGLVKKASEEGTI